MHILENILWFSSTIIALVPVSISGTENEKPTHANHPPRRIHIFDTKTMKILGKIRDSVKAKTT